MKITFDKFWKLLFLGHMVYFRGRWDYKYSKVFFNTLNQKTINESKTYDPSLYNGGSLWSSLGGVLSLFLGISFAMFFEVSVLSETDTKTGTVDHIDFPQVFEILIDFFANVINFGLGRTVGKDHHML